MSHAIVRHFDLEKQEGCGVVAQERLPEPRVTIEWLLAKQRSFLYFPAFRDLNVSSFIKIISTKYINIFLPTDGHSLNKDEKW